MGRSLGIHPLFFAGSPGSRAGGKAILGLEARGVGLLCVFGAAVRPGVSGSRQDTVSVPVCSGHVVRPTRPTR